MSLPYYEHEDLTLYEGDCRTVMAEMEPCSVDAIVTDPPYGIGFMGKAWDRPRIERDTAERQSRGINSFRESSGRSTVGFGASDYAGAYDFSLRGNRAFQDWCMRWGEEALRILKPGASMVVSGSPRTYHRLASGLEDAGFEVRDCLMFLFGSGFPKSLQVNKDARFCSCSAVPYNHEQGSESSSEYGVRSVRETDLSAGVNAAEASDEALLESVQEQSLSLDGWPQLSTAEVRPTESGMEGRSNVLQDSRELHGSPLRESAAMGEADGTSGRLHHGASPDHGGVVRLPADENGSGEPHRSHPVEQRQIEPGALADERGSQEGGIWPLCSRCGKPVIPPGLGTALKPAYEPIILARKPLIGTVAANVQQYGTGGLNIDGCRIGSESRHNGPGSTNDRIAMGDGWRPDFEGTNVTGRWPANVLLDTEAAHLLDAMSGDVKAGGNLSGEEPRSDGFSGPVYGNGVEPRAWESYADRGGASRFFYTAKTSRSEREFGLDDLEPQHRLDSASRDPSSPGANNPRNRANARRNDHPTVKPVDLMRWLCRLVTPPNGLVLDPFLGSGSTGMAALDEGFRFVGIDMDAHYLEIAQKRITRRHLIEPMPQPEQGQGALL